MNSRRAVRSTREQIADRLRDDVFSGRLPAGEHLSEVEVAARFGVSRGPIREAMSQLATEGLLLAKPNCGMTVAPPAPPEVRDLVLPIRKTLEVYALRAVFDQLGDADFRHWDDILFQMERACRQRDVHQYAQLDVAFHRSILERSGQPDVLAVWHAIVTRMRAHFWDTARAADEAGDLLRLHAHHVQLIDAFRSGNKAASVQALKDHIDEN